MAFLARHDGVAPDQRKSGDVVIEECCSAPTGLSVTLLAPTAELAFVAIVLAVTRHTGGRQLVVIKIAGMAPIAVDLRMRGSQWKFRRLVMIEANRAPLVLVVASFALGAVPTGVDILNPVAIHTSGAHVLVAFAVMARGASDATMCALKRELRPAVVEWFDTLPCRLTMTIFAGFSETPLMQVNRLVAVETASGCVSKLYHYRMTAAASHCLVCVAKRKIRERVIEGLAVKLDDVGIAAFMICMTMGAFLFHCIWLTPVKSPHIVAVCGNLLMARKAKPSLRVRRERLVATAALLLELGMSGDDRSGHDQFLE